MSKLKPSNFSTNILKTHIVTKLKNLTWDKTQKLKLREHPQIQIEAKIKNSDCDNTQNGKSASRRAKELFLG